MEVKLQIDSSQLAETVTGLLANLTQEQKVQLAKDVYLQFLTQPPGYTAQETHAQAMAVYRARNPGQTWVSDSEVLRIKESLPKTPQEALLDELHKQMMAETAKVVAEFVKTDPTCIAMREEVCKFIQANFGAFVHDAFIKFFAQSMNAVGQQIEQNTNQLNNVKWDLKQACEKIGLPHNQHP